MIIDWRNGVRTDGLAGQEREPGEIDTSVAHVARCEAPVAEPGIDELYVASRRRLTATLDGEAAVQATECTMLVVPTPSLPGTSLRDLGLI